MAVSAGDRAFAIGEKPSDEKQEIVDRLNEATREAFELLGWKHPVGRLQWIHVDKIHANDYNPNAVPAEEMRLLHTSIANDGYTMPIVTIRDEENDRWVIVDGFHRYTTMRKFQDIYDSTGGYLPVSVIEKSLADRIASTVRHNRARGKHSVAGMGSLVFQMLEQGENDETICAKVGLDAEELSRLKHITGYSKLYANREKYSNVTVTGGQLELKAEYKKNHPDEEVQQF